MSVVTALLKVRMCCAGLLVSFHLGIQQALLPQLSSPRLAVRKRAIIAIGNWSVLLSANIHFSASYLAVYSSGCSFVCSVLDCQDNKHVTMRQWLSVMLMRNSLLKTPEFRSWCGWKFDFVLSKMLASPSTMISCYGELAISLYHWYTYTMLFLTLDRGLCWIVLSVWFITSMDTYLTTKLAQFTATWWIKPNTLQLSQPHLSANWHGLYRVN